jgi:hypothetical protein
VVILQYDFKTVASRAQRKVKAGRLLFKNQLVKLGGSFRSGLSSALTHRTCISQLDGQVRQNALPSVAKNLNYYTTLRQMKKY